MVNYDGNFLDSTAILAMTITGSLFQNITQNTTKGFIYMTGAASITFVNPSITSTKFENIWVRHSVMLLEQNTKVVGLSSVVMNNIHKIPLTKKMKNAVDIEYESVWSGGICMLARVVTGYTIEKSNFTNIHSHCIGLTQAVLKIDTCIFDNSGLVGKYTSSLKNTSLTETDGFSYVILKDGTGDVNPGVIVEVLGSQFINNVNYPRYGGV